MGKKSKVFLTMKNFFRQTSNNHTLSEQRKKLDPKMSRQDWVRFRNHLIKKANRSRTQRIRRRMLGINKLINFSKRNQTKIHKQSITQWASLVKPFLRARTRRAHYVFLYLFKKDIKDLREWF